MSTELSFRSAIAETEAAGVPVRLNDPDICCRSCYVVNDPREVWNLTQNGPLEWVDGNPVHSLEEEVPCTCTEDEYDEDDNLIYEGEQCDVCTGHVNGTEVPFQRGVGILLLPRREVRRSVRRCPGAQRSDRELGRFRGHRSSCGVLTSPRCNEVMIR